MLHQRLRIYLENSGNTIMNHASASSILQTFQSLCADPMAQITCIHLIAPGRHFLLMRTTSDYQFFFNSNGLFGWQPANISRMSL